jgi:4-diphosphocytidyl-2C-methyl-D-erythritol kinase
MNPSLHSPAKINLFLEILRRRADGYHTLDSVFQEISLGDRLRAAPRRDGRVVLSCDDPSLPVDERNLVRRAADAWTAARGPLGVTFRPLTKRRSRLKLTRALKDGAPATLWAPWLFNRLEEVVLPRLKPVGVAKSALLQAGCLNALMSGSGSSVFGVVDECRPRAPSDRDASTGSVGFLVGVIRGRSRKIRNEQHQGGTTWKSRKSESHSAMKTNSRPS